MAIRTQQFTVSTTAVELRPTGAPTNPDYSGAEIRVTAGARDMFIGPSGVTTATGFKVPQGTTVALRLGVSDRLYGIAGSSGTDTVLRVD